MGSRANRRWWAPSLLAAAAASCVIGPREVPSSDAVDDITAIYCDQMFECDCSSGRRFEGISQCQTQTRNQLEQLFDSARSAEENADVELQYDATCLGAFEASVDELSCDAEAATVDDCRPPCNPFYGDRREGDSCSSFGNGITTCAKGLSCDGVCYAPCGGGGQRGESCEARRCDDGLFCNIGVCDDLPSAGEACPSGQCADGAFCGTPDPMNPGEPECIPLRANGEACSGHLQCQSSHCPVGSCAPLPGRNEACPADLCAPGLNCQDEVCVQGDAAICFLSTPY